MWSSPARAPRSRRRRGVLSGTAPRCSTRPPPRPPRTRTPSRVPNSPKPSTAVKNSGPSAAPPMASANALTNRAGSGRTRIPKNADPKNASHATSSGRAKLVLELLGAQLRRPEDKSLLPSSAHGHLAHGGRGCEGTSITSRDGIQRQPSCDPRRRRAATGHVPPGASCPASSRPLRVSTSAPLPERCATGWRWLTTPSTASSICTPSPCLWIPKGAAGATRVSTTRNVAAGIDPNAPHFRSERRAGAQPAQLGDVPDRYGEASRA